MFNLSEIVQNAQDGKAVENLAQQFGITPDQAQSAVQALIPAISTGLLQKAAQPGELGSIISAITDPAHQAAFSDPDAAQSEATVQKGSDTVSDMFGSSHIANQIAQQASSVTGLRPDVLMQMLPVLVSIILGGLAKSAQNQGFGGMLGQLAAAAEQGNLGTQAGAGGGGLMGMLSSLLGGLFGGSSSTSGTQSTMDNLTKMFQPGSLPAEISQSGLTDQIGKILGGKA
jgi:hypothetical protein